MCQDSKIWTAMQPTGKKPLFQKPGLFGIAKFSHLTDDRSVIMWSQMIGRFAQTVVAVEPSASR